MNYTLYFIHYAHTADAKGVDFTEAYNTEAEALAVVEQMRKNNDPNGVYEIARYIHTSTWVVPKPIQEPEVVHITLTGNKMVEIPIESKTAFEAEPPVEIVIELPEESWTEDAKPEKKGLPKRTLLGDILSGKVELDGDRDVENTLTDEVFPCICDMVRVTEEGMAYYAHVMAMPVRISRDYLTVTCTSDEDVEELRNFCYAQAGYIDSDLYDRYFQ